MPLEKIHPFSYNLTEKRQQHNRRHHFMEKQHFALNVLVLEFLYLKHAQVQPSLVQHEEVQHLPLVHLTPNKPNEAHKFED